MKFKFICLLLVLSLFQYVKPETQKKADIIVFSFDRPIQLYAYLESVEKYLKDVDEVWVIYRSSNERYEKAYESCFQFFPNLNIKKMRQSNQSAGQTFKPLLMHSLKSSKNKHVLFGVDDIIVKDYVSLSKCIEYLEKTDVYGFYLRLGKNITECYTEGIVTPTPNLEEIDKDVYLVNFKDGKGDWGYPCTVDMTVYNKEKIMDPISRINFESPNRFEGNWHLNEWHFNQVKDKRGLLFGESKIVNIPMNVAQTEFISRNMGVSKTDLLEKFEQGLKINIESLYKIYNKSPHIEFDITFTSRFQFEELYQAIKNKDLKKINELKLKFPDLIEQKANGNIYNLKDENGYTPLMWAANVQSVDAVKLLLENKVDVNEVDKNGCSALIFACWRGNPEIVELLVKNKVDLDVIDVNGTTALSMADQLESPAKDEVLSILLGQDV